MSSTDATSVAAAAASPFTTSFLRDGATGKSYAIIHFSESYATITYTVYERETPASIGTGFLNGTSSNRTGATVVFPINKGFTYFVVANTGNGETLSWTVDPNKRRVGSGVSGGAKKRSAEGEQVAAAPKDEAAPAAAAPASAAAAAPAVAAPKEKKEKAAPKEPKEKKSKATA